MKQVLHVLYIPGVGDDNPAGQRWLIMLWRLWGVHAELVPMRWSSTEPWEQKRARLLALVDQRIAEYGTVSIVAASAGSAAALWVFEQRKQQIAGCVTIAGKIVRANTIGPNYSGKNVALVDAVKDSERAVAALSGSELERVQSRYALFDGVVDRADSKVPGMQNHVVFSFGHVVTIASQLLVGAPFFVRFLRKQAARQVR